MAPITLRGVTIDPNSPPDDLPRDASNTNFILVQTTHALSQQESSELSALGVDVQRVQDHHHTYLCRYEPTDLTRIEELPFVKHALPYDTRFVIDEWLKDIDIDNLPSYLKTTRSSDDPGRYTIHLNRQETARGLFG